MFPRENSVNYFIVVNSFVLLDLNDETMMHDLNCHCKLCVISLSKVFYRVVMSAAMIHNRMRIISTNDV